MRRKSARGWILSIRKMKILFEKEIRGKENLRDYVSQGEAYRSNGCFMQKAVYSPFKLQRFGRELSKELAQSLENRGYAPIKCGEGYFVLNNFGFDLKVHILDREGLLTDNLEARQIEVEQKGSRIAEKKGLFGKKKQNVNVYEEIPAVFARGSFSFDRATMDDGIEPNPNAVLKALMENGYEFKLVSTKEEIAEFERALKELKKGGLVRKVA